MVWNNRIVKYKNGSGFGLHEVYYNSAGEPCAMTENPKGFAADVEEGSQGVIESLELALSDAKKHPVLDEPEVWAKWDGEDEDGVDWDDPVAVEEFIKKLDEDNDDLDAGC